MFIGFYFEFSRSVNELCELTSGALCNYAHARLICANITQICIRKGAPDKYSVRTLMTVFCVFYGSVFCGYRENIDPIERAL